MEVLFILAVVAGIVALIVKAVQGHHRLIAEAWQDAATQLGMSFTPGSVMRSKSIKGQMYENRVEVDTFTKSSGQSSTTYTRYRIHFPESLGLGLHLKEQGFMASVASFFGSQDIEIGDPQFDPQVVVKGSDPRRVAEFLTPSRRLRILRLFQNYPGCEIKDPLIEWSKQGNQKQADVIVGTVRRLAFAAARLRDGADSDQSMDRALEARRDGRLDDALQHVRELSGSGEEADPDLRILEGQILEAGGREEEAAEVYERARRESPEDEELAALARVEPEPPPQPEPQPRLEPEPPPEPEPAPPEIEAKPTVPEPASVEPTPAAAGSTTTDGPDVASVCNDLFGSGVMSFEAKRRFDERYKGRTVRWSGELRRVSSYQIDMVFKGASGTKMTLDLTEVEGSVFGRTAQAIVQLPPDALEGLRTRVGENITFEGRLLSCDALMRNLFVSDAKLV